MKKIIFIFLLFAVSIWQSNLMAAGTVKGELKRWHKVMVDFTGPQASENDASTFLNYRLDVTFTNGNSTYVVPGFFAADGNAAESGASSGNIWRVNFCPDKTGTWAYTASFRKGTNVAVSDNPDSFGTDNSIHGQTGTFTVSETDKTGRDMRAKGRLRYIGEHHLQYQGSGEYLMKAGPDSPENLLAYYDIDNTGVGGKSDLMKTWQPHVQDWNSGDPTWKNGKGKGLIGALNYLEEEKMNAISFLTMNSPLGDDRNVVPWIDKNKQTQYDCSKLDQWEIIFSHAQAKGLHLHFKTQETENELVLDNGAVGTERKLYYRELIARFAHHNSLEWNICEEGGAGFSNTNQTQAQRRESIAFIADNDPYKSNVVLHTAPGLNAQKQIYNDFLGNGSKLTGVSLQNHWDDVFETTHHWVEASANAGRKWVVANDEQGNAQIGVPHDNYTGTPNKEDIRKHTLWGNLMAGGAGVNYYFGYGRPDGNQVDILFNYSDMSCQDFRSRDISWDYARYAVSFFDLYLPFWEMHNDDSKTSNTNSHCLMKNGVVYVVYLRNGGTTNLSLPAGTFNVDWFNPRTGGALTQGTRNLNGGGNRGIGNAPGSGDWVALVRNVNFTHTPQWGNGFSVPDPNKVASVSLNESLLIFGASGESKKLTATVLPSSAANKNIEWTSSDENVATVSSTGLVTATGLGRAVITASSTDGTFKMAKADVVVGTTNCDKYTYGPNWVVFEADITTSDLDLWVKRTPGDGHYMKGTRAYGPIGEDYIEFTGNDENGGTPKSPLVYKFTAPKTAKYTLGMRLLQNLEGAEWDKSNDVWIRMDGNFTSGNAFSTDDLKHDHKYYGRGKDNWGAGVKMEGHVNGNKTLVAAQYNLIKGEEYTFTMSGRAQRTCIDYIIFYESSMNFKLGEEVDIASENPDTYWPDTECDGSGPVTCQTILSKDFDKISGITGYDNANLAPIPNSPANAANVGEVVLGCGGTNGTTRPCAAEETYTGVAGDFFFSVNAMAEPDGECTYEVFVNGVKVGEAQTTRIHGTNTPAYTVETLEINSTAVALKSGDVIRVTFNQTSNNLVPEGNGFATARGRWRSIEICSEGNAGNPVENKVEILEIASEMLPASSIPLKASYTASGPQEIVAICSSPTGEWLGNQKIEVQAGSGVLDMNITIFTNPPLPVADGYNINLQIRPVGSTAADKLDEKSALIDVVSSISVEEEMSPIHDAYLQGSTLFNNADLRVEAGNRVSYLQFDLNSISGQIKSMSLELTVGSDAGNGTINILDGSHSNWTENNLSSGNAPGQGAKLDGSTGNLAVGQTYSYDVSAASIVNGKVTLVVTMNVGGNDVSFASKENGGVAAPKLTLTISDVITGTIDQDTHVNRVYPNPTSGVLYFTSPEEWTIRSILGEVLIIGDSEKVDIAELESGMYLITQGNKTYRITKQ